MKLLKTVIPAFALLSLTSSCKKDLEKFSQIEVLEESKAVQSGIKLNDMFGVNTYEWNFLQDPSAPAVGSNIFEPKMSLIKSFSGIRHYLDWEKLEDSPGSYTFNPTRRGGWNY
ncbi:MAG: hypothetical protein WKF68_08580, partial [Daejeonella sp.]